MFSLNKDEVFEVVSALDTEGEPTVWLMKPLTYQEVESIQRRYFKMIQKEGALELSVHKTAAYVEAFIRSCIGWRNLDLTWDSEGRYMIELFRSLRPVVMELGEYALDGIFPESLKNS
jgi:hypothetical protein